MPATLEVYGKNKLMARLAKLQNSVLAKASEDAIKAVAVEIRDTAKGIVPVDTGSLRTSIRLQVYASPATYVRRIGVSAGGYVTNPKTGNLVNYASYVERGTSKMVARPYIQPAIEQHKDKLPKEIGKRLIG